MARFASIGKNGETKQFTAEQETARDAEEKAFEDRKPAKKMYGIRAKRDALLTATDWWGASDNTMSDSQTAYRLALRNFPATVDISNIVWPTKP